MGIALIDSYHKRAPLQVQTVHKINSVKEIDDLTAVCEKVSTEKILGILLKSLQNGSTEVQAKTAEIIAELAKTENCRVSCVEEGLVPILVEKMDTDKAPVALQACRALGNICYEYDGGRMCVISSGGSEKLLNLLKRAAEIPNTPENHQLRLVATGFLLNLLNSYDSSEDHPLDTMLIDVLCHYLEKFAIDEDIPTHILLSLSCLADSESSRELVISKNITPYLVNILNCNESAEVVETCLELITNLAETDCVKTQFASGKICEAVIGVINRHIKTPSPDLSPPIIKTATDLLVLILVGDESMLLLYNNGEGEVYKELVNWLSSNLEDLQIAGALAVGNFARNDSHCIKMVNQNIGQQLLQVLSGHNSQEGDIRLQHALLSALRNLSIAKENKPIIVKQGALETLLPMISTIETYPVVFKLLATLRMIIDGQLEAAIKLGQSEESISKIVAWSKAFEHPGVQGEASRILAWIIKNCDDNEKVHESLLKLGSLSPLITMLSSEHVIMVNEATLALALMFRKLKISSFIEELKTSSFMFSTISILKNQSIPPEVIVNVLSSLLVLSSSVMISLMSFLGYLLIGEWCKRLDKILV
ncbi:Rap1 GTPase-GDP dissociation stimulator 1-A [Armadillidium vulgare]|nr:Rap1 GTPase-GDP dissociation stimulator 1-A [Armadillidium vulgare]